MSIWKKIGFFCAFIIPALVVMGYYLGGFWNFGTIVFVFVLIPIFDELVGKDPENVDEKIVPIISEELYYRLILYGWVFVQMAFVFWGCYVVSSQAMTSLEMLGFMLSFPLVTGGIGITVAHELGHKKGKLERFYSKVLLMTTCYMHFYIEHNRGHHVNIGTPLDPATSRKGEHFYAFWLRSVRDSYLNAWKLEFERMSKKGLPRFSSQNDMIWFSMIPLLFCLFLTLTFSLLKGQLLWEIPAFFFVQSILGFSLLEAVNYIEHYGLLRKEIAPKKYEKVNTLHSWNANQLVSNFFLFQLQRHSDHHAYANRSYQALRHVEESPQLPAGYPAMILLSLFPPFWFRVMDKKLAAWKGNS
ncbi:MAG: alkane 1-monooxygenase [Cytophagales bacterium]|nr:MAG: alkane 1-monooxygenase [Cytophagales bacterium]